MTEMEHVNRVFDTIFGAFNPPPVYGESFWVNGREYSLVRWRDGWVWRDEREVNDSTDYGHGPWAEAWEAQRDAMRDARERV